MKYAFHDLYPGQFEELVVATCHELLGPGVQEFATGPDGGRDARFVGTAQCFPSETAPWKGKFIVQAKHTTDPVAKFSDGDFSGDGASAVLTQEIHRIRTLVQAGQLDRYVLFSNRRLGGNANDAILQRLEREIGLKHCHLVGTEALERYMKKYPKVAETIRDCALAMPLRVSPDELAEVITELAKLIATPGSFRLSTLERVKFKDKNALNGLSRDYGELITKGYLKDFDLIRNLLSDPASGRILKLYEEAANDFQSKLIAYRTEFKSFDLMLTNLIDLLIERDGDLRTNKRLTRTVIYYMYWNCDIGQEPPVTVTI